MRKPASYTKILQSLTPHRQFTSYHKLAYQHIPHPKAVTSMQLAKPIFVKIICLCTLSTADFPTSPPHSLSRAFDTHECPNVVSHQPFFFRKSRNEYRYHQETRLRFSNLD